MCAYMISDCIHVHTNVKYMHFLILRVNDITFCIRFSTELFLYSQSNDIELGNLLYTI